MAHNYDSGAKKRQKVLDADKRKQELLAKVPKLSTYFKVASDDFTATTVEKMKSTVQESAVMSIMSGRILIIYRLVKIIV